MRREWKMDGIYLLLKSLHLLGVIIFLGNIIITGFWKVMADRTKDLKIAAFAQRQVTLTDFVFTTGGVALTFLTGEGIVRLMNLSYSNTHWLRWGLWLFIASGIIWVVVLIPIQIKQAKLARRFTDEGNIPIQYWRLGRIWVAFGAVATLLPLVNLYWMVFKPS
jgi:uncharacterized membrane protein